MKYVTEQMYYKHDVLIYTFFKKLIIMIDAIIPNFSEFSLFP